VPTFLVREYLDVLLPYKYDSTETAMQRVWSDILVAADDWQVMLVGLLDLSAAFDCVDHSMLLERLQSAVV